MQYTPLSPDIQKKIEIIMQKQVPLATIVALLHEAGARIYLVGGAVRDLLLGIPVKDLDIEVHGISMDELENILKKFGIVAVVGKSYGVLRLMQLPIDWSIPRVDKKGRKPIVQVDPYMGFAAAALRRDLTMNALGIDLFTNELLDPYHGVADMQTHRLRTPDVHKFIEDPLRFFRVMQFIGRFEMYPDDTLNAVCRTMDITAVSRERIEEEFKKLLLQSRQPSRGIRWLNDIDRLAEVLPEIAVLQNVAQNPHWHPEGDVYEHTMQAIDAAAALTYNNNDEKLILLYAALCHDLGKAKTTTIDDGVIKSHGHEVASADLARKLLRRITRAVALIKAVVILVRYHMQPGQFITQAAKASAYKRLALKLAPLASIRQLALLAYADKRGRNGKGHEPLTEDIPVIDQFIAQAKKFGVYELPEKPLLQGKDLLDVQPPGPALGALVKKLYSIQIAEGIVDKKVLKERAKTLIEQKNYVS